MSITEDITNLPVETNLQRRSSESSSETVPTTMLSANTSTTKEQENVQDDKIREPNSQPLEKKSLTPTSNETSIQQELNYQGGTIKNESSNSNDSMTDLEREQIERESRYLTGRKLVLVFTGMLLSVFLIALDQTILAPSLVVISSQFNDLEAIAWIASAYFLTQASILLLYGQALTVFDRKWTFLFAITVFELGSLICGIAPTVNVLIFGRAFAGCGAAGIFVSVLSIISEVTTLQQRPKLFGLFGGVFAISSVVGPVLGGVFTDKVSWRLCFYINLPFGAVTIAAVMLILGPTPAPPMKENVYLYTKAKFARYTGGRYLPTRESVIFRLASLDWVGSVLMLALITCLLLPLQWGGNKYAWSDPIIIGTFCAFGVLVFLFVIFEWKFAGPSSILPLRFFKNRSQIGACLSAFFLLFTLLLATYYLPIFFQATRGDSATKSGIDILPFMLGVVFLSGVSGGLVSHFGYYWPFLVGGPVFICIGSGLLYTIDEFTPNSKLIGYQIILACGVGLVMQNLIIAVQADIEDQNDVSQATGIVTFAQLVGGTIGIAIASSVFGVELSSGLHKYAPTVDFNLVRNSVSAIYTDVPVELQAGVIHAYVKALNAVFLIGIPAGAFASLSALLIRNISVKGKNLMEMGA